MLKTLCGCLLLMLFFLSPSHADSDHERSRAALLAGEIQPLRIILTQVEQRYPGQVLEVELERRPGKWFYEVTLLHEDGRLLKLIIDAKSGQFMGEKFHHPKGKKISEHEHADINHRR